MEAITNQLFGLISQRSKASLADIGDVKIVNINYSQYSSRYDAFKRGEIAPAFNPEMGGGALRDLNVYKYPSPGWPFLESLIVWNIYLMWSEE